MKQDQTITVFIDLAAALCRHPDKLDAQVAAGNKTVITLTPLRSDYGALYGRQGQVYEALKVVASAMLEKQGREAVVLLEERDGERATRTPFAVNHDWLPDKIEQLLCAVGHELFEGKLHVDFEPVGTTTIKATMVIEDGPPDRQLYKALARLADFITTAEGRRLVLEITSLREAA